MTISSRTPEGDPNRCPVCGNDANIEPSTVPTRDAPCPHCGSLMWFGRKAPNYFPGDRGRINRLAEEVAHLSEMELAPAEYYGEFLQRLLTAIAAPAGAVWLRTAEGNLQLEYQINMRQVGLDRTDTSRQQHDELLRDAFVKGQPEQFPPQSGDPKVGVVVARNPTPYMILMAPILHDNHVSGLVEVWQEPTRGPDAQRGFLQFMVRMAGLASGYTNKVLAEREAKFKAEAKLRTSPLARIRAWVKWLAAGILRPLRGRVS